MTAHAMKGDKERCLSSGMDAYVTKPIQTNELLDVIESIAKSLVVTPTKNVQSKKSSVNMTELLARVDGDMSLLKEIVEIFLCDAPNLIADIQNSIACGDAKALERSAHALKGSVGNFAAKSAFEAAFKLEQIGRNNDMSKALNAYIALEEIMEQLKKTLVALDMEEAA
jgi:HPt (histidine-containing phosphotransfer) domain-containing protein